MWWQAVVLGGIAISAALGVLIGKVIRQVSRSYHAVEGARPSQRTEVAWLRRAIGRA